MTREHGQSERGNGMWEQAGVLTAALVAAYLVGSLPTAYVLARVARGIDLRHYGSGNVGAANAAAQLGKPALVAVVLGDFAKGALPVAALRWLNLGLEAQALAGLAVVAGHNWSIYLRFTGGRGMAPSLGVLLGLGLWLVAAAVFAIGESSLWMAVAAAVLPALVWAFHLPSALLLFSVGLLALLAVKRITGNREPFFPGLARSGVLLNRLLYDRDVRDRQQWLGRKPPTTVS